MTDINYHIWNNLYKYPIVWFLARLKPLCNMPHLTIVGVGELPLNILDQIRSDEYLVKGTRVQ